jgi:hypothetical protein
MNAEQKKPVRAMIVEKLAVVLKFSEESICLNCGATTEITSPKSLALASMRSVNRLMCQMLRGLVINFLSGSVINDIDEAFSRSYSRSL